MGRTTRVVYRRIAVVYAVSVALYVVLGVALLASAYADTQSPVAPYPTESPSVVPTGHDDESVKAYFDYLNLQALSGLEETYVLRPVYLLQIYGIIGALLFVTYFFIASWYSAWPEGDLYPVEVYNGYITERGGPVGAFNWAAYVVIFAYMAYYVGFSLVYGQIY